MEQLAEPTLETRVKEAAPEFPLAAEVVEEILRLSPLVMRSQLAFLIVERGLRFWQAAERLVRLARALGGSPARSLVEYTIAILRDQVRFLKSGEYTHADFEQARQAVYDNPEVMENFYLEGLMLTHAFWPIHFDVHAFFAKEFLPRVANGAAGAEVGFGHGLYLLEVLENTKGTFAQGYDISEFSRKYAAQLLRHGGVPQHRFRLEIADVRNPLSAKDGVFRWAIFAEVLEHVPDPLFSLREIRRCLAPDAPLFLTTVVNSNALDHLWLFKSVDEVDEMVRDAGLEVLTKRTFAVADYGMGARDPTVDVVYLCQSSPS